MNSNEAFVLVAAIIVGGVLFIQLLKYGAQIVRDVFGTRTGGGSDPDAASLTQGEVEGMIRRAVREEVKQEVQPLREEIERLEQRPPRSQRPPRRDLPEDPHDFGLIAGETEAGEEHAA